jgi:hypothetical protein
MRVTPIYTTASARCGISTKSLWRYIRASQREDDPESYRLIWCDVEEWFHNYLKQAMRMSTLQIEAAARHHGAVSTKCRRFRPRFAGKKTRSSRASRTTSSPGSERWTVMSAILTARRNVRDSDLRLSTARVRDFLVTQRAPHNRHYGN